MSFNRSIFVGILSIVAWLFASVLPAAAHPVFAQKHGVKCSACHITPITDGTLNSNGQAFKDNGYKFGNPGNPPPGGNPPGGTCIKLGDITICK